MADIGAARRVAYHDFGSHRAQGFRTLIVTTNDGAHPQITLT
jgi:hypothetical protein